MRLARYYIISSIFRCWLYERENKKTKEQIKIRSSHWVGESRYGGVP